MKPAFISYVRDDTPVVAVMARALESIGIGVWLDRESIRPGTNWRTSVAKAIRDGACFVACFSENYHRRDATYMNEEISLAIELMKQSSGKGTWFVPVRLTNCKIPPQPVTADSTLADLQAIDLFPDIKEGLERLAACLAPALAPAQYVEALFKKFLTAHLDNKRRYFDHIGAQRLEIIERRWLGLLDPALVEYVSRSFLEQRERARETEHVQTDRFLQPGADGRVIILSVSPSQSVGAFLDSLGEVSADAEDRYASYVTTQRRWMRGLPDWTKRDLVHMIFLEGNEDATFDMLYLLALEAQVAIATHIMSERKKRSAGGPYVLSHEYLYPTCLMSAASFNVLIDRTIREDLQFDRGRGDAQNEPRAKARQRWRFWK